MKMINIYRFKVETMEEAEKNILKGFVVASSYEEAVKKNK